MRFVSPFDLDWKLPADRRLPIDRIFAISDRSQVEGATLAASEPWTIQKDARIFYNSGVTTIRVCEHSTRRRLIGELEAIGIEGHSECPDLHCLVIVEKLSP